MHGVILLLAVILGTGPGGGYTASPGVYNTFKNPLDQLVETVNDASEHVSGYLTGSRSSQPGFVSRGDTPVDKFVAAGGAVTAGRYADALGVLKLQEDPIETRLVRQDALYNGMIPTKDGFSYPQEWFHPKHRPFNAFPEDEAQINLEFRVLRPSSGYYVLKSMDEASYQISGFNTDRPTAFYIHGFQSDTEYSAASGLLSGLFHAHGRHVNVVAADWKSGAAARYTQALGNIRLVARLIADLLRWLHETHGLQLDNVHLIGHSLGAHTAGYVGKTLRSTNGMPAIGRITGLDPAKSGFENMDQRVRLDHSDAMFVDVIHTDDGSVWGNGLGTNQVSGHMDVYVNGGGMQPGCTDSYTRLLGGPVAWLQGTQCRHGRALELFTDSLYQNDECWFVAYECESYREYLDGRCDSRTSAIMGYHASPEDIRHRVNVKMFLNTGSQAPFCLTELTLRITLTESVNFPGKLRVSVKGGSSSTKDPVYTALFELLNGNREGSFPVRPDEYLGAIQSLTLTWLPDSRWKTTNQVLRISDVTFIKEFAEDQHFTILSGHPTTLPPGRVVYFQPFNYFREQ